MRSAFWNGVALLNESESDMRQNQGPMAGPSSAPADTKGFSEVPKNVTLLQPVIQKLMDKVAPSITDLPQLTQFRTLQRAFLQNGFQKPDFMLTF